MIQDPKIVSNNNEGEDGEDTYIITPIRASRTRAHAHPGDGMMQSSSPSSPNRL